MGKLKLKDILKPGVTLDDIPVIDYNSPVMKGKLREMKEQSERCLRNKKVNWDKLSRMYMTV